MVMDYVRIYIVTIVQKEINFVVTMSKLLIIKMIVLYSHIYGVNPNVSVAVAMVESNLNPNAIGITKDLGIFQLNPSSFPQFTKKQLLNPKTNIMVGIKYLAKLQKECNHKGELEWLVCYNLGPNGAKKVKHPRLWPYLKKVKREIARVK